MFKPVVPLAGYTGWKFLQRTLEKQTEAFVDSAPVKRATDHFREKIGSVLTAEQLVADRQLLEVALGAFGLDDDINNRFFIKKILEDGTQADDALSNRLADKRYREFAQAFGLGNGDIPRTLQPSFADDITRRFEAKQFERAVGEQNEDLRFALNLRSGISDVIAGSNSEDARWFGIMGNPPLRRVFEVALGLPKAFSQIDIDQQLGTFKDRADAVLGSSKVADLDDPAIQEKLIRLFLIRSELETSQGFSSGATALALLRSVQTASSR